MNHSGASTHLVWRVENGLESTCSPRMHYGESSSSSATTRGRPAPLSARGDISYYRTSELPTATRSVTQVRELAAAPSPRVGSPASSMHLALPVNRLRSAEPLPQSAAPPRVYQAVSRPRTLTEVGPRIVAVREAISPRRFVVEPHRHVFPLPEPGSVPVSSYRKHTDWTTAATPTAAPAPPPSQQVVADSRRLIDPQQQQKQLRARRLLEQPSQSRPARKPASSMGRVVESSRIIPRLPLKEITAGDTPRPMALTSREARGPATHKPTYDKLSVTSGCATARTQQATAVFRPTPHKRGQAAGATTARIRPGQQPCGDITRAQTRPSARGGGGDGSDSSELPSDASLSTTSAATSAGPPGRPAFHPKQPLSTHLFETIAMIGQGGYAVVRVVRHRQTHNIFALKQVAKADFTNVQQLRMAYTEVEILRDASAFAMEKGSNRRTRHIKDARTREEKRQLIATLVAQCGPAYFPKYYGCWQDEAFIYFLMEYLPGGDLMKHLIDREIFPEEMAKFYAAQIALAIGFMHDHLRYVHRDIKPDNVLFDCGGHTKLVDFGLSRKVPPPKVDADGRKRFIEGFSSAVGTPDYMAPEVHRPGVAHDRTIDWWSLGIILYEMLFGGPPLSDMQHRADVTSQLIRNWRSFLTAWPEKPPVSDLAKDLLGKLIAEKADRYQTVEDVLSHPWFDDIDLNDLRNMEPPIVPKTSSQADVRNFDSFSSETLRQWEEKKRKAQPSLEVSAFLMDIRTRARRIGGDTAIQIPFTATGRREGTSSSSFGSSVRRPGNFATDNDSRKQPVAPQSCTAANRVPHLPKVDTSDAVSIRTYKRPVAPQSRPATCDVGRNNKPYRALHESRTAGGGGVVPAMAKPPDRIHTDDISSSSYRPTPRGGGGATRNVKEAAALRTPLKETVPFPGNHSNGSGREQQQPKEPPASARPSYHHQHGCSNDPMAGVSLHPSFASAAAAAESSSRTVYNSHHQPSLTTQSGFDSHRAAGGVTAEPLKAVAGTPLRGAVMSNPPRTNTGAAVSSRSRIKPPRTAGPSSTNGEAREVVSTVSSVAEPRTVLSSMSSGASSRRRVDASQVASAATETEKGSGLLSELTMAVSRWLTSSSSGSGRSTRGAPAAPPARPSVALKATGTQVDQRKRRNDNALGENVRPNNNNHNSKY